MPELISAVIGAVVGAIFAYGFGFLQVRQERRRRRRSLATVMLADLRAADVSMRNVYESPSGLLSETSFQSLGLISEALDVFRPETVNAVLDVVSYLNMTRTLLQRMADGQSVRNPFNTAVVRLKVMAFLDRIPVLLRALESEGGERRPFVPLNLPQGLHPDSPEVPELPPSAFREASPRGCPRPGREATPPGAPMLASP